MGNNPISNEYWAATAALGDALTLMYVLDKRMFRLAKEQGFDADTWREIKRG